VLPIISTVVNAMTLYSFEDPAFPFVYILPRGSRRLPGVADSCNYLYSFSFLLFTFLLATRERRSP
jgi:hypothetical protein